MTQIHTPATTDIATVARGFGARGFTVRDAAGSAGVDVLEHPGR